MRKTIIQDRLKPLFPPELGNLVSKFDQYFLGEVTLSYEFPLPTHKRVLSNGRILRFIYSRTFLMQLYEVKSMNVIYKYLRDLSSATFVKILSNDIIAIGTSSHVYILNSHLQEIATFNFNISENMIDNFPDGRLVIVTDDKLHVYTSECEHLQSFTLPEDYKNIKIISDTQVVLYRYHLNETHAITYNLQTLDYINLDFDSTVNKVILMSKEHTCNYNNCIVTIWDNKTGKIIFKHNDGLVYAAIRVTPIDETQFAILFSRDDKSFIKLFKNNKFTGKYPIKTKYPISMILLPNEELGIIESGELLEMFDLSSFKSRFSKDIIYEDFYRIGDEFLTINYDGKVKYLN